MQLLYNVKCPRCQKVWVFCRPYSIMDIVLACNALVIPHTEGGGGGKREEWGSRLPPPPAPIVVQMQQQHPILRLERMPMHAAEPRVWSAQPLSWRICQSLVSPYAKEGIWLQWRCGSSRVKHAYGGFLCNKPIKKRGFPWHNQWMCYVQRASSASVFHLRCALQHIYSQEEWRVGDWAVMH